MTSLCRRGGPSTTPTHGRSQITSTRRRASRCGSTLGRRAALLPRAVWQQTAHRNAARRWRPTWEVEVGTRREVGEKGQDQSICRLFSGEGGERGEESSEHTTGRQDGRHAGNSRSARSRSKEAHRAHPPHLRAQCEPIQGARQRSNALFLSQSNRLAPSKGPSLLEMPGGLKMAGRTLQCMTS